MLITKIKILLISFAVILLVNFGDFSSKDNISLERDLRITNPQSLNDNLFFGDIFDLVVDSQKNIFVADWQLKKLWIFNKKGDLIKQLGGGGKGPGEFSTLGSLTEAKGGKIAALDLSLLRITYFDSTHNALKAQVVNLAPKKSKTDYGATPIKIYSSSTSQNIYIEYNVSYSPGTSSVQRKRKIYVIKEKNLGSEPILNLPENDYLVEDTGGSIRVGPMPFGRKSLIQAHGNKIYVGWNDKISIRIYDSEGNFINEISDSNPNVSVTSNDIKNQDLSKFYLRHKDQFPKTFPAFDWFIVDYQGRIWVAANTEDRKNYSLRVFDKSGTLIAKTSLTKTVKLQVIRDGYAYGIQRAENGKKSVVRYKVTIN